MAASAHIEQFKAYLSERGLKFTRQRQTISEVFFTGHEHPSLLEILDQAREQQPSIGYATVYRTMKLLTECGLATEHKFGESDHARYEPNTEDEHHDHLICMNCGAIVEFEDERIEVLQEQIAAAHGFQVEWHRHEIYGRCGQCQAA